MRRAAILLLALGAGCAPAPSSKAEGDSQAPAPVSAAGFPSVGAPRLSLPIACRIGETCVLQNHVDLDFGPAAKDYRCGLQTYDGHNGVDIRLLDMAAQRRGVDVLAAAAGRVVRLRDGVADISVKAPGAPPATGQECGNGVVIDHGGGWETQYCHVAQGSVAVKIGDNVAAGQPIARVGLSGNTEYPHLHLTLRRAGAVVDPFAPSTTPGACDPAATPAAGLWDAAAAQALAYRRGVVLNAGFAAGPAPMEIVEAGGIAPPTGQSPLVAYVRAVNLEGGDIQELVVIGPDGGVLAQSRIAPLDRAKAQYVTYAGKRPPAGGWPPGEYKASYTVRRKGEAAITKSFSLRL